MIITKGGKYLPPFLHLFFEARSLKRISSCEQMLLNHISNQCMRYKFIPLKGLSCFNINIWLGN
jgi:hypothetical protein